MLRMSVCFSASLLWLTTFTMADEPVFSGPQPGEKVTPFKVRGVLDDLAGKEVDLVSQADGKPLMLVFIHEFNRPSIGLTRLLMDYAARRSSDGLVSGVIFLNDDPTESEGIIKRARHALPQKVPLTVSLEGQEGPGAYGLNRAVTMTILLAKDNVVKANFALVQPSVQADAEKIAKQMVELLGGGQAPTLADLGATGYGKQAADRAMMARDGELENKLRVFINKSNDEATVKKTAEEIEKYVAENEKARARLGQITNTIVKSGKLDNYGTPAAREYLRKWSEKFPDEGAPKDERKKR